MKLADTIYWFWLRELLDSPVFILLEASLEVMGLGFVVARPLWQHC